MNSSGISSRYDAQQEQQQPYDSGYEAAGHGSSSSSSRPPSQQLTEGLSKLKQLSSARLVNRLTTPPSNSVFAGGCQQQQGFADIFGAGSGSNSRATSGGRCCSNAGMLIQQQQQQGFGDSSGSSGYTPSSYSISAQRTTSRGRQSSMAGASVLAQAAVNGAGRGGAFSDAGFAAPAAAGAVQYQGPGQLQHMQDEDGTAAGGELLQCGNCGRSFNAAALQRHAKVCEKVFCQKRKVSPACVHHAILADSSAGLSCSLSWVPCNLAATC
jgi:hypothetical protein